MQQQFRSAGARYIALTVIVVISLGLSACATAPPVSAPSVAPTNTSDGSTVATDLTISARSTSTTPATTLPDAKPKTPALGRGDTFADALYLVVKPKLGENLSDNGGNELFVRVLDAGASHPEWGVQSVQNEQRDFNHPNPRVFWFELRDGSRITFEANPSGNSKAGLVLTRVYIRR